MVNAEPHRKKKLANNVNRKLSVITKEHPFSRIQYIKTATPNYGINQFDFIYPTQHFFSCPKIVVGIPSYYLFLVQHKPFVHGELSKKLVWNWVLTLLFSPARWQNITNPNQYCIQQQSHYYHITVPFKVCPHLLPHFVILKDKAQL